MLTTPALYWTVIPSPLGELMLCGGEGGLKSISWDVADPLEHASAVARGTGRPAVLDDLRFAGVAAQLGEWAKGQRREFDIPLEDDPRTGQDFRARVLRATTLVPWGETRTYADIAQLAGSPGAARAVGQALGRNPLPIVIPCHRVVGSGRRLGGFSGGTGRKAAMLSIESGPDASAGSLR